MKPIIAILLFSLASSCSSHRTPNYDISEDDLIVVLNFKEYSRNQIGEQLQKLSQKNPTVVGIDAGFFENKEPKGDSILLEGLMSLRDKVVIGCSIAGWEKNIARINFPASIFLKKGIVVGHYYYSYDSLGNWFQKPYLPTDSVEQTMMPSFAHSVATLYDDKKSLEYINIFNETRMIKDKTILIKTGDEYPSFDLMEVEIIPEGSISGKIVLLGYTGPSNEDKKRTTLRHKMVNPDPLDTYGVYINANQIEQILRGEVWLD